MKTIRVDENPFVVVPDVSITDRGLARTAANFDNANRSMCDQLGRQWRRRGAHGVTTEPPPSAYYRKDVSKTKTSLRPNVTAVYCSKRFSKNCNKNETIIVKNEIIGNIFFNRRLCRPRVNIKRTAWCRANERLPAVRRRRFSAETITASPVITRETDKTVPEVEVDAVAPRAR